MNTGANTRPTPSHAHVHGPPSLDWEAPAKQGRTTGEVLSVAIAAVPIVSGGVPALERAIILPRGTDSPPDRGLGLVGASRPQAILPGWIN